MNNKHEMDKLLSLIRFKGFSIKISEYLHKRFEKHLKTLKHAHGLSLTKQKWLSEAFLEKLSKIDDVSDNLNEKILHFKIETHIFSEINARVETIRKFRNFSKTQWMLEAIYEKLEREEKITQKVLEDKINS